MSALRNPRLPWIGSRPALIGVVHLLPTPGSPGYAGALEPLLERAREDARALLEGGADALVVENFGDAPFHAERVPPETIAALALALGGVRALAPEAPLGVNVLRNDARAALGLAAACGAQFVRVNVHIGAAVTDQGLIQGRAADTVRERERLAPQVAILTDVHVKHAAPLGESDIARAAVETYERGAADALIVSGTGTGQAVDPAELARVRAALPDCPLLLGSGVEPAQAELVRTQSDGAIVGTWLKAGGRVGEPVDPERVRALRRALDGEGG